LTDAQFLRNNYVTCESNHVKIETMMMMMIKAAKNFRNRSRELPIRGDSLPKKWKFLTFWGRIEVKFCTAKRTHVPIGPAKFDLNRCNDSPLQGEKPDFWPVSKFNTGRLPLCGNLAGNNMLSLVLLGLHQFKLSFSRFKLVKTDLELWYGKTCFCRQNPNPG